MFLKKKRVVDAVPSENMQRILELDKTIDFGAVVTKRGAVVTKRKGSGRLVMGLAADRKGFSENILRTREVAIAHTCFPDGGEFPSHTHKEFEYILVYRGRIMFHLATGDLEISKGMATCFDPGQAHAATIEPKTCLIAVTMPPSPDWPTTGDTNG